MQVSICIQWIFSEALDYQIFRTLGVPLRVGLFAAIFCSSPHKKFPLLSLTHRLNSWRTEPIFQSFTVAMYKLLAVQVAPSPTT
jgi:hypothetical protein